MFFVICLGGVKQFEVRLRHNVLSVLIWVQNFSKAYHKTSLAILLHLANDQYLNSTWILPYSAKIQLCT